MSQVEPLKPTFERDAIKARIDGYIDNSLEQTGEVNRDFTGEVSVHDLTYDELRNLNGAISRLDAGNEILLKAIVDNTATIADRLGQDGVLDSIDERICEANNLLFDIKAKQVNANELRKVVAKDDDEILEDDYGRPLLTQEDIDEYVNSVKDYWVEPEEKGKEEMKKVKLAKNERHIIYQALGSRVATMRNQIGYTRVNDDGTLRDQITKCENLIKKLKNS